MATNWADILASLKARDATATPSLPNYRPNSIGPAAPLGTNTPIPSGAVDQFLTGTGRFDADRTLLGAASKLSGTAFASQQGAQAARDVHEGHNARAAMGAVLSTVPLDQVPGVGPLLKKVGRGVKALAGDGEDWAAKHATQVFDHYSTNDLSSGVLDPAFMGTGNAGRERLRPGRIPSMHVYDAGSKPEDMFRGADKYNVHVSGNIADLQHPDLAPLVSKVQKTIYNKGGVFGDVLEKQLNKEGYAGYRNGDNIVKLFGSHPVTPDGVPLGGSQAALAQGDKYGAGIAPQPGNADVQSVADGYARPEGALSLPRVTEVPRDRVQQMAHAYDNLPKNDPAAASSYAALNTEIAAQKAAAEKAGYRFDFVDGSPYKTSDEMHADVRDNRRIQVNKTTDEQAHPYLTSDQNNAFRAVHDFYGHAAEGHNFGIVGEENAYRAHAAMFSPDARRALATETRGQNSWVNAAEENQKNLPAQSLEPDHPNALRFPEQKAALWPDHLVGDYDGMDAGDWAAKHAPTPVSVGRGAAPAADAAGAGLYPAQHDIPRLVKPRVDRERVNDIQAEALKTYTGPEFTKWMNEGHFGDWYHTQDTEGKAIDALGEEDGPKAFSRLMEMMGATTARSDPGNNLRRASYYRGLEQAGLLDPDALRAGQYKAVPTGMGHLANNAHHSGLAGLLESGSINPLTNPKPAGFVENLRRNMQPFTNDTRMATGAALANPKLLDLGAIIKSVGKDGGVTYSPRDWAYAPMERAAQEASALHAKSGALSVPNGVAPTADFQAKVWDGLSSIIPGASPSQGKFSDVFNAKLAKNAAAWGVSHDAANKLFWAGHPFDLPLNTNLIPRGLLK